eukprot:jgi/Astpho2/7122/e_gw1.00110.3.1_t
MKPQRMRMTHELIKAYELDKWMDVYRPCRATEQQLQAYHIPEYVAYLRQARTDHNPKNWDDQTTSQAHPDHKRFNFGEDCPAFDGLFSFCQLYAGGSIHGAKQLAQGDYDIVINWAGGLHHARKAEASGFCYVNDLVLAILELLKTHARVLYVDIDIHHGDGVEEAFYTTDRVMTVSFHSYGKTDTIYGYPFFPGTGAVDETGLGRGRLCSLNVPFSQGVDDPTFHSLFKPVMTEVMQRYKPGAIVLQCGADSLRGDKLGSFMMSIEGGHAEAVRFMKQFGVPMLVTGGGGYTKKNVARCWTYETAVLLGREEDVAEPIPPNRYISHQASLANKSGHPSFPNLNTREYLDKIKETVLENLRHLSHAPGVLPAQGLQLHLLVFICGLVPGICHACQNCCLATALAASFLLACLPPGCRRAV